MLDSTLKHMKKPEFKTMINATSFKPGRLYSVVYDSPFDMVQSRMLPLESGYSLDKDGAAINPLPLSGVTVRRTSTVQAAGNKTWANYQLRKNPNWTPNTDKKRWYSVTENSCIVEHNQNATRYLRALARGVAKEQFFIDGKPATTEETNTILAFAKNKKEATEFVLLNLDNLCNVNDDGGDEE